MNSAFTICSNNYLARAKVVADTFTLHHPESKFFIFLIDQFDSRLDYSIFESYTLIKIQDIVPNIDELANKYNIIELSTAVKPAVFIFLFSKFKFKQITYLDPDLQIFDAFTEVEEALLTHNIVLTPHFCSPIDDGKYPSDLNFIPFGIYNLGFIAVKFTDESQRFLEWWHNRLMKYCYINPSNGMFTDQLWVNYAPVYFEGCFIIKHLGYNMANWNLYERHLSPSGQSFVVNNEFSLKFFHFSHYQFDAPESISKFQTRYTFDERKDIIPLFESYRLKLIHNKQEEFSKISSCYQQIYLENKEAREKEYYTFNRKLRVKLNIILKRLLG
ncbi:hypothetical protein [Pontibacter beigongshangensis]|uniref:hypothetical protein n=1 Tax=Pontibacter beigongshangensis TaxID=2574733 RepID=UPI00164FA5A9|nr:hypothetical protein [Pontibacter beigongshangensis]